MQLYPSTPQELERMRGIKTTVPVVMEALGTMKVMEKYTSKIPGNININEL